MSYPKAGAEGKGVSRLNTWLGVVDMNLKWAVKGELATSSLPVTEEDVARLKRLGFGAVLSLHPVSLGVAQLLREAGIIQVNQEIVDFSTPGLDQMDRLKAILDEWRDQGKPVLIHCYMGVGRCRTVACAYLASSGYSPEEALELVGRPETVAQASFVEHYHRRQVEAQHPVERT